MFLKPLKNQGLDDRFIKAAGFGRVKEMPSLSQMHIDYSIPVARIGPEPPKVYDVRLFVGERKRYGHDVLPETEIKRRVAKLSRLGFTAYPAAWTELRKPKTGELTKRGMQRKSPFVYGEPTMVFERVTSDPKELERISRAIPIIKKALDQEEILEEITPVSEARFL